MAVDFSLLPAEMPLPENAPSQLVWTVVFFVLYVASMFAVLMLWPTNLPTRTPLFWITLAALPFCISSLVVLRRLSAFEARKLDVMEQNEAARNFNERVFGAASKPLVIVAHATRISADPRDKTFEALLRNTLKLAPQRPIALRGDAVKARWLVVPGVVLSPGRDHLDLERQRKVVQWIFEELLTDLTEAVQALPVGVDLSVQFAASSVLTAEELDVLWTAAWIRRGLRMMHIDAVEGPVDLASLDFWLDQSIGSQEHQARLIIAIQLHPLLSRSPPEGSTEAAVAILLMPDALAEQHDIDCRMKLHRPVRSKLSDAYEAMMPALKWANAKGADIAGRWLTGFSDTTLDNLVQPEATLGLNTKLVKLDESVGFAGIAAPWLALACASTSLSKSCPLQMVLSSADEYLDCAVLRCAMADPAFTSSADIE